MTRFITTFAIIGLFCASHCGCSSKLSSWKMSNMFDLDKGMPWESDEKEIREGTPVRMMSSWVDTVKHTQGELPKRGFGGRILFYDDKSNDSIKVEGEMVVYAFDESERDPIDNRPTRRFVFPAEQVALHMSESALGPSYSFFLPWDEVGGPQTEISLICRFKPAAGTIVVSEQTRHLLPGVLKPGSVGAAEPKSGAQAKTDQPMYKQLVYESGGGSSDQVEQASFKSPAEAKKPTLVTTSIELPRNYRMPNDGARNPVERGQGAREGVKVLYDPRSQAPAQQAPYRPLPSFNGPSAMNSPSYRQAAAFSAKFSGGPVNPATANALGPDLLSPFSTPQGTNNSAGTASLPPEAAHFSNMLSPPVMNPRSIQPVGMYWNDNPEQRALPTASTPAAQVTTNVNMPPSTAATPVISQSLQPNAAAAAAIPPAYITPEVQQQLSAGFAPSTTKVSYLSPAESLQWERGQRSFGSQ